MRRSIPRRHRRLRPVALSAVLLLALTGCATDGDGAEADTDTDTDTEADADTGDTDTGDDSQAGGPDGDPITIGVVTSRTGDLAPTGVQVWAGVQFAAQEINAQGGIDGRPIEVVVEDDRSNPTDALNAFQKLTSENDPVAVWGPTFTPLTLAMEPAVVEAQVPTFVSPTAPVVTERGEGWFFRTRTNDIKTGAIAARVAVEDLEATQVAFLYPNNDYGVGGYEIMGPAIAELGAEEVAAETYNQGDRDISAQLLNIQRSGADLLIPWTVPVDSAMLVNQAADFGLDIPILGGPGYATEEYLDLVGEATDGNYALADAAIASEEVGGRPEAWEWVESFKSEHPDIPVSFVVSVAYDSANLLFDVLADGTATDAESVREALRSHPGYEGVSGTFVCDDENNCLHQADVIEWDGTNMNLIDTVVMPPE